MNFISDTSSRKIGYGKTQNNLKIQKKEIAFKYSKNMKKNKMCYLCRKKDTITTSLDAYILLLNSHSMKTQKRLI